MERRKGDGERGRGGREMGREEGEGDGKGEEMYTRMAIISARNI